MIEGDLSNRSQKMIREWAQGYQKDLKTIWETQNFQKLTGLE